MEFFGVGFAFGSVDAVSGGDVDSVCIISLLDFCFLVFFVFLWFINLYNFLKINDFREIF